LRRLGLAVQPVDMVLSLPNTCVAKKRFGYGVAQIVNKNSHDKNHLVENIDVVNAIRFLSIKKSKYRLSIKPLN
jgi:hypothetical protein